MKFIVPEIWSHNNNSISETDSNSDESVSSPSSNTWSRTFKTSGWAFSISSKRITEYGFFWFSLSAGRPLITDHIPEEIDYSWYWMLFHIFGHIKPDKTSIIFKKIKCQCFSKLCFSNSAWSEENKWSSWFIRSWKSYSWSFWLPCILHLQLHPGL